MSKGPSSKALLILTFVGALGVGALAWYVKSDPSAAHVPMALRADSAKSTDPSDRPIRSHRSRASQDDQAESKPNSVAVFVQVPKFESGAIAASQSVQVPEGVEPHKFVAEQVVKGALTSEVRVLGVDIRNRVATINFGSEVTNGMGSDEESNLIKGLQTAFGQFPNVDRIEIYREGEPVDSLGHIDLTDPIKVLSSGDRSSSARESAGA